MSKEFKYKKPSKEVLNKRANQSGSSGHWFLRDDVETFSPKDDKKGNQIRLMPPTWDEAEYWGYEVKVHYNVGSDNSAFLCLKEMKKKKCPICEEHDALAKKGKVDEEYLASLKPTRRVLMYVIDRKNEGDGPLVWAAPWTVDKEITIKSIHKKTGDSIPLDSPTEGYDIFFKRDGKGRNTKYTGFDKDDEPSPLSDNKKKMREWLEFIEENPLPSVIKFASYEEIAEAFSGGMYDYDSEKNKETKETNEDEEETLTWNDIHEMKRRKLEKLASEKTDIDEEDMEDMDDDTLADKICDELGISKSGKKSKTSKNEDEDEDEEDEKPKKDKKSKKDEDEDEEDEDEEDEDEEDEDEEDEDEVKDKRSVAREKLSKLKKNKR